MISSSTNFLINVSFVLPYDEILFHLYTLYLPIHLGMGTQHDSVMSFVTYIVVNI